MKKRLFQQRMWMQTVSFYVGLCGWVIGIYWLAHGVSAWWMVATVVGHVLLSSSLSVGYHRYFTHHSFECPKFWQYVFGVFGVLLWTGSPIQWVALHTAHHRWADTERDPHYTGWSYLFVKRYRKVPLEVFRTRRLARSPFHRFLHAYYALIGISIIAALYLVSPKLLVFGYLMPAGYISLGNGLHQVLTHGTREHRYARNYPVLEYVFNVCGEWLHGRHHENAGAWDLRTKWWHFDLGALVVKAIRV